MGPLNKTALITGASSGLGAEFAHQIATRGYDLILVARRKDRLDQLAQTLSSSLGIRATVLPADLSNIAAIRRVIEAISNTPNLELLVNNAGFAIRGRFYRADSEKVLTQLHVHMLAPVMLVRAALPAMLSKDSGAIINVASLAGLIPIRSVLYGSTKSFLINFSIALQDELRDSHVRVQALCPGYFLSEFHDTAEFTNFSRKSVPGFLWMNAERVASESLQSLSHGKVICIPGNINKLAGLLAQNSLTSGLITLVARFILRRRRSR